MSTELAAFLSKKLRWSESQLKDYIDEFEASKTLPVKNWEIWEFRHNYEDYILATNGLYNRKDFCASASLNHIPANAEITSVRRLPDGEVFKLHCVYNDSMGRIMKPIKKFMIGGEVMYAVFDEGHGNNDCALGINSLSKLKQPIPLFTTHNGVEVFEKQQEVVIVFQDFSYSEGWWASTALDMQRQETGSKKLIFSTKESAKEYILMNKPCLSINDVLGRTFPNNFDEKRFKEYLIMEVKSKLNQ